MIAESTTGQRWGIILAGGEGERLKALTQAFMGQPRPKQYCEFLGGRSMLEHTAERAAEVLLPNRLVTVIGRGHWRYLESPRRQAVPGLIVEQPAHRDTGPGVLLPLTYILALDPQATVALFPSDHFIHPASALSANVRRALALAERLPDRLVLLGAQAERPEPEYGWIAVGDRVPRFAEARVVTRFVEKPPAAEAAALQRSGALWNTLIMAFKGEALWSLACRLLPGVMSRFQALRIGLEGHGDLPDLGELYAGLDSANFSSRLLTPAAHRCVALPLSGVRWSDWGRPERIAETLASYHEAAPVAALARTLCSPGLTMPR